MKPYLRLDVSIQSQIINLLIDLRAKNNLTYLFITHRLECGSLYFSPIGVMYFGRLVELASAQEIFDKCQAPIYKRLLNAIPSMDEERDDPWAIDEEFVDFEFHYRRGGGV